jgi:hypothetical protein
MSVTLAKNHKVHIYIYVEYQSSELGLPHPLSRKRKCHLLEPGEGAHSPAGEGVGECQFRRLEKKLSSLSTLCSKCSMSQKKGRALPDTLPASIGSEENRCIYMVYLPEVKFSVFYVDEFNLKSFDLSPGLGFPPLPVSFSSM